MKKKLTLLTYFNGLTQLALSQIHIAACATLYTSSSGFYLFLFILFSLIAMIQVPKAYSGKFLPGIILQLISIGLGVNYMIIMLTDNVISASGIDSLVSSIILLSVGILLHLVTLIGIVVLKLKSTKKVSNEKVIV